MTDRPLLVMLPGAFFKPGDFADHGFLEALRRQDSEVDAIVAHLPAEHYLEGDAASWLHAEIIGPAVECGQRRLWLLGISLGAMGALLYSQAHPEVIEGMVLLAPFVGSSGLVAAVAEAGGLAAWTPGPISSFDVEVGLMAGLKAQLPRSLYVGYGTADRFAAGARLLAAHLPPDRVFATDGGHDWPTWERLWKDIIARAPWKAPR
jgi:pimeloyl-ACP methyl ester carboxylesterase